MSSHPDSKLLFPFIEYQSENIYNVYSSLCMKSDAPESYRGIFLLSVGPTSIKNSLKCSQIGRKFILYFKCHFLCSFAVYLLSVLKFATFFVDYPYAC